MLELKFDNLAGQGFFPLLHPARVSEFETQMRIPVPFLVRYKKHCGHFTFRCACEARTTFRPYPRTPCCPQTRPGVFVQEMFPQARRTARPG